MTSHKMIEGNLYHNPNFAIFLYLSPSVATHIHIFSNKDRYKPVIYIFYKFILRCFHNLNISLSIYPATFIVQLLNSIHFIYLYPLLDFYLSMFLFAVLFLKKNTFQCFYKPSRVIRYKMGSK